MPSKTLEDRFWEKVDRRAGGCWEWTACLSQGYGRFKLNGKAQQAHRIAYEWLVGPIPEGLDIDHLCRNRACVNPDHLEPVTNAENARRSIPGKRGIKRTHCKRGHLLAGDNIMVNANGKRQCLTCIRAHWARANQERSERRRRARNA